MATFYFDSTKFDSSLNSYILLRFY